MGLLANGSGDVLDGSRVVRGNVAARNKPPKFSGRHLEIQHAWPVLLHCLDLELGCAVLVEYFHPSAVTAWRVGRENALAYQCARVEPICDLGLLDDPGSIFLW